MEKNEMPIVGASAAAPSSPVGFQRSSRRIGRRPRPGPCRCFQRSSRRIGRRPRPCPCRCFQRSSRRIGRRPVQSPVDWDPYEPVQCDAPENPYDTTIVDYEPEICADDDEYLGIPKLIQGGEQRDVDSDDESFHTKTRHVLRRLQSGQYDRPFAQGIYKCPFCNRRLFDTNFNTLLNHVESIGRYGARVGRTVNVHAYMAKHKALGIHLRNLQASHTRHLEALNVPTALSVCDCSICRAA
ncbi:hypothetical protein QYE76_020614 [Lolium multiflorum]|uniref:Uncharacterized protein n=1 Tax=Lolium multiflorum TaxID=4521 RepID=A0AAD8R682_LOLMU|nr:hypothetical protein QYE76_020614 [Lolium multiflorum]